MLLQEVLNPVFARMMRLDAFYCDKHCASFSRVRLPDYYTFSENMALKYPGSMLNDSTGLIENRTLPDINLDSLMELLRSKDICQYEKVK